MCRRISIVCGTLRAVTVRRVASWAGCAEVPVVIGRAEAKSFEDRGARDAVFGPDPQDAARELASSGQLVSLGAADAEGPARRREIHTDGQRLQLLHTHPTIHPVGLLLR